MQHSVGVQIHGHPRRVNPEDRSLHRACSHQRQSTPGNPAELVHAATVQGQAAKECHFGRDVASVAFPDQEVGSIGHEENNRVFALCSQPWNQQRAGSETLSKMSHSPDKRFPHLVASDTNYRCAFSHDLGVGTAHFLAPDWRNRTHLPVRAGYRTNKQPTQHSRLNNPGTSRGLRHVDDDDTSGEARDSHDANHTALDRGRALSTT